MPRPASLDPAAVRQVIRSGAAGIWLLPHLAPRSLAGDFDPGFLVGHLVKDIRSARACGEENRIYLPGLATAQRRLCRRHGPRMG